MIWCLHGALGQTSDWDFLAEKVSAQGEICRAVDLWRFLDCEGLSLSQWAKVFNAEVKAATGERNVLVGYSMGGRLALHALLEEPALWDEAVIISAHPGLVDADEQFRRMADDAEWAALALTGEWSQLLEKWDAQGVLAGGAKLEKDSRLKLVNRRRAIARSFMEWSLGKQADLSSKLKELTTPITWVTGERDEKFTALAQELVPQLRQGRHQIFPCGHRVLKEANEELLEVLS